MVLLIDITNERSRVGLLSARRAIWRSAPSRDAAVRLIGAAKRARLLPARGASCVIAAVGKPGATRDASWSAVRAAVATANALAFSWGVPSATVAVSGDESDELLARLAASAARAAGKDARASASYDGEPNITKSKNV